MTNKTHSPLITISKRPNITKKQIVKIRTITLIIALIVCCLVSSIFTKKAPHEFLIALIDGNFGTENRILNLLEEMAILLIIALAITPAFKMKFWNIGAEGQVLVASLASGSVMFWLGGKIPDFALLLLMLASSLIAGIIWTIIPAIFKAIWNTNETLFTLMMNYIAAFLVSFCINKWVKSGSGVIGYMEYGLPELFGKPYIFNFIIVAIMTILVTIYFKKSKHGYELTVVGESVNTAKYIGIGVKKVIIRTMILSGTICGVAGFILVAGYAHTFTSNLVGGKGFTAIIVSWLANFEPINMIFTSFLVGFINMGSKQAASTVASLGASFSSIMTGIFFLFIVGSEFFMKYNLHFHFKKKNNEIIENEEKKVINNHEESSVVTEDNTQIIENLQTSLSNEDIEEVENDLNDTKEGSSND